LVCALNPLKRKKFVAVKPDHRLRVNKAFFTKREAAVVSSGTDERSGTDAQL
jgi:hypothetical protein